MSYVGCMLVFVAEEALARAKRTKENNVSIELARVLPSYVGQGLLNVDDRLFYNHVIGVVAPVCVRAEASSLARVCWQRVE